MSCWPELDIAASSRLLLAWSRKVVDERGAEAVGSGRGNPWMMSMPTKKNNMDSRERSWIMVEQTHEVTGLSVCLSVCC